MYKTIFFDFDGVLTIDKSGSFTTCKNLQKYLNKLEFEQIYKNYRLFHQELLIGQETHQNIWEQFCKNLNTYIDIKLLYKAFDETPMNKEMLNLCTDLKKNYKIGIITDNSIERLEAIKKSKDLNKIFDFIIVSGAIGSKKNKNEIFLSALKESCSKAEECIFIDNNKDNLIIPNKIGMKTIYHDHETNNVKKLKKELLGI